MADADPPKVELSALSRIPLRSRLLSSSSLHVAERLVLAVLSACECRRLLAHRPAAAPCTVYPCAPWSQPRPRQLTERLARPASRRLIHPDKTNTRARPGPLDKLSERNWLDDLELRSDCVALVSPQCAGWRFAVCHDQDCCWGGAIQRMADAHPLRSFSVLQHETAALLAPQFVGSGLSLGLYGVYIVLHYQYAKSDLYRRLSWPVKATLALVCVLVTVYEVVQYADTMYWSRMSTPPSFRIQRSTDVSTPAVTVSRTPDDIFNGVPLDSVIPLLGAVVAAPVQILLLFRAALVSKLCCRFCNSGLTSPVRSCFGNAGLESPSSSRAVFSSWQRSRVRCSPAQQASWCVSASRSGARHDTHPSSHTVLQRHDRPRPPLHLQRRRLALAVVRRRMRRRHLGLPRQHSASTDPGLQRQHGFAAEEVDQDRAANCGLYVRPCGRRGCVIPFSDSCSELTCETGGQLLSRLPRPIAITSRRSHTLPFGVSSFSLSRVRP